MPVMTNFHGLIPAMAVPLHQDGSVDAAELTGFARWLVRRPGIVGMMTNGHTGEVFRIHAARARRDHAHRGECGRRTMSGRYRPIVCEGITRRDRAGRLGQEAGAQALDIMPPHHWLRFGFRPSHVIEYFKAIGEACGLPLIVHVYPAWTKASFSSELLAELALLPIVAGIQDRHARDEQVSARSAR